MLFRDSKMPLQELSQTFPVRGREVLERNPHAVQRGNPGDSGGHVQVRHPYLEEETQLELVAAL